MRYAIEWVMEGSTEIEADSEDAALRIFRMMPVDELSQDATDVQENTIIPICADEVRTDTDAGLDAGTA